MLNNRLGRVALLALLPLSFYGCSSGGYQVEKITASHIEVDPSVPEDVRMEAFLAPYRDSLSALMDQVSAYSPQSLSKNDQNGLLGAWLADLSIGQVEAYLRSQGVDPQIDIALFNAGGERTSLPQGEVKRSFVYEFMPFENKYMLVRLRGEQMEEMFRYLADAALRGTFHPLGGLNLQIRDKGRKITARIGGKRFDPKKEYTVLTTDFLYNGGDNMTFFAQNQGVRETTLKMRESIMDYFAQTDTITLPKDLRYEIK